MDDSLQHVFLVGAKNLGTYGGYETFVNKLTEYHSELSAIKYHVACKANGSGYMDESALDNVTDIVLDKNGKTKEFTYHNAHCFKIKVPNIGAAEAIFYDVNSLSECCKYIEQNNISHPIVYIMACRIGPFAHHFFKKIHKLGGLLYVNPDGLEWKRAKWNFAIQKYWKKSCKLMVKNCDLVVCDSVNIEKKIHTLCSSKHDEQSKLNTTYIAYGADTQKSTIDDNDEKLVNWYNSKNLVPNEYYLIVARFVPENNFETMIREFMLSKTKKSLVIISTTDNEFYSKLENNLHFKNDERIKFVGTVYDQELLKKIRENAYGYLHGHEVGGTNPSLLEALSSTKLNLLLNIGFNKEVAQDSALYWNKDKGNLSALIDKSDLLDAEEIIEYGLKSKKRISDAYTWDYIADEYRKLFLSKK
jgi:rhamnosyltransferase